jgi:large subunit ribosomal protein L9
MPSTLRLVAQLQGENLMQVLLLKDVEGLGHAGDIKAVSGGYAKNYLLARNLAVPATDGAQKQAQLLRDAAARRQDRKLTEAKMMAARLEGKVLNFKVRAGEGERLYGSVTNNDIAEALAQLTGLEIERRNVEIEHSIKTLGEHEVVVKLGSGVSAVVRVNIDRAEEE